MSTPLPLRERILNQTVDVMARQRVRLVENEWAIEWKEGEIKAKHEPFESDPLGVCALGSKIHPTIAEHMSPHNAVCFALQIDSYWAWGFSCGFSQSAKDDSLWFPFLDGYNSGQWVRAELLARGQKVYPIEESRWYLTRDELPLEQEH